MDIVKRAIYAIYRRTLKKTMFLLSRIVILFHKKLEYEPFEHEYNCGQRNRRMTERGMEMFLVKRQLEKWGGTDVPIIEVGAVTPYYFPGRIPDILDFSDSHALVNHRTDMFDFDYTGYNVLSVSTIEHVGRDDYDDRGVPKAGGNAVDALEKILGESVHCMISWPIGYNRLLDTYALQHDIQGLVCYKRGKLDNDWRICSDKKQAFATEYSHLRWADAIAVIER